MNAQTRSFRNSKTGEVKEFTADSYENDLTTMRSTKRESVVIHCYRAVGDYRIDEKPDGTYRDKWGVEWVPV